MYYVILLLLFAINFSTAIASIAVGLGFILIVRETIKTKKFPQVKREYLIVFGIYFLCRLIIAILSIDPAISLREFLGEFHRCLPFFFALIFIKDKVQLKNILIVILLMNIADDLAGCYQKFFLHMERPLALNYSPTFFGSFTLMQFPMNIFIAFLPIIPTWARRLALFACGLTLLSLALTLTRGAWLAFFLVVVIYLAIEPRYRKLTLKIFSAVLVVCVICTVLSPTFQSRINTITDMKFQANSERILMWESSWQMFKDYPIHGLGMKLFERMYNTQYISPDAKERPNERMEGHSQPHNNFLNAAVEGGIIGLFSFVLLHGYFWVKFYRIYRRGKSKMIFPPSLTALLILSGLLLEGLTDTNMSQVQIMREYWTLIGTLLVAEKFLLTGGGR